MKNDELVRYAKTDYLTEGHAAVLNKVKPIFSELITGLVSLPEGASVESRLDLFRKFIEEVNELENEIETVEREAILHSVYQIGSIVGLDPDTGFAEEWRGDW
jgi:hypothetical protein